MLYNKLTRKLVNQSRVFLQQLRLLFYYQRQVFHSQRVVSQQRRLRFNQQRLLVNYFPLVSYKQGVFLHQSFNPLNFAGEFQSRVSVRFSFLSRQPGIPLFPLGPLLASWDGAQRDLVVADSPAGREAVLLTTGAVESENKKEN